MVEMCEQSDFQLLRDYAAGGHDAAFHELVIYRETNQRSPAVARDAYRRGPLSANIKAMRFVRRTLNRAPPLELCIDRTQHTSTVATV
jgi:hypothetical protein